MASFVYNIGARQLSDGTITWTSSTIMARLVATSATPDKDDDDLATGYTAIGSDQTLGTKSVTTDDANDQVKFVAANPTWTAVAGGSTVGWCIVYYDNGGNGIPLFAHDVADTATNGGDITIDWPTVGGTDGTVGYSTQ